MYSLPNTELNPEIPFLETLQSAILCDGINPFVGQDIDVNSYIISCEKNFESESVNQLSYHFEQEFTSTDI
ncbi:MAG: hypothetical protein KME32_32010 [Mojavia pulchra JT2-VF2]|jgi:hypothetical protein|uniref:Uncharacterized protein n=1 Tax=Mojavia pulchra JT2-VF2 TaxID=287848 RepID=A0A951Q5D2_9NOST|nr:hypothetical protein [Mojavia pulchra JT2-VF2]